MLEIGKIINTHGIRGELKIQPWCDDSEMFSELEYFMIDNKKYEIEQARLHKNNIIAKVKGINSINDAEIHKNKIITVPREELGELPEGTYYIADLIGLVCKTPEGKILGEIEEVIQTGSNDVYVLKKTGKTQILIPALKTVINEVNINEGFMIVTPPEGLISE